mgnify:CR=1 FL=1
MTLIEGQPAPYFNLSYTEDDTLSLNQFKGKNIILFFYPKDETPGCTLEACGFRDAHDAFLEKNTVVLGISKDTPKSHKRFTNKYNLPFPLLSDETGEICQAYGVWGERKMYGRTFNSIIRSTFFINTTGMIEKIWYDIKVPNHVKNVLDFIHESLSHTNT